MRQFRHELRAHELTESAIFALGVTKQQIIPLRHAGLIIFRMSVNVRILELSETL